MLSISKILCCLAAYFFVCQFFISEAICFFFFSKYFAFLQVDQSIFIVLQLRFKVRLSRKSNHSIENAGLFTFWHVRLRQTRITSITKTFM